MNDQSQDAPHCSQLPGFKTTESLDMQVTPTISYERTRQYHIINVLKPLHVPVSAIFVFILRDVLYKGYTKKGFKKPMDKYKLFVIKMYSLKYIIFSI